MSKNGMVSFFPIMALLASIPNKAVSEEPHWIPKEINPHSINEVGSEFSAWSHATGVIGGTNIYVASIPDEIGCASALYELNKNSYYLVAATDKYDCGTNINYKIKNNSIETKISIAGSSSVYSATYKFSKKNHQYMLIGVEQRAEYGNAEKYYKHGLSLNTLNSKATEWYMKYCLGDYKVPCKSSKSYEIVKLKGIYQFSGFNHEELENEIKSGLKLPPLW